MTLHRLRRLLVRANRCEHAWTTVSASITGWHVVVCPKCNKWDIS